MPSHFMDFVVKYSILYAFIFSVIVAVFVIQRKHKDDILLHYNLIEKMLIFNLFFSFVTLFGDFGTLHKPFLLMDLASKNEK